MKILFLLKKNHNYGVYAGPSTGLYNSANILAQQLHDKLHFNTKLKICVDGNSVDKEVTEFKPNVCVLEAIWVTPTKLSELAELHPSVKFVVRVHSELPFLANEGMAITWIREYQDIDNVVVGVNSQDTYRELKGIFKNVAFLPNVYEPIHISTASVIKYAANRLQFAVDSKGWTKLSWEVVNIGCFGAIRPMKNQLIQAVAAINYANKAGVKLRFHMNATRVEQQGDSVLKNIRALFYGTKHELIEYPWMSREIFLDLINRMDLGLQVSFNESFNIVTADFVKQDVPIVVSPAVKWAPEFSMASPVDGKDIEKKIGQALRYHRMFRRGQKINLLVYNYESTWEWLKFSTK